MSEDIKETIPLESIPKPVFMADDAIERWNLEGKSERSEPLQIVDKARIAMAYLANDKSGIVLGSGRNTNLWKDRGWKTLDINPTSNADYVLDANEMDKSIDPTSQDFLFAEQLNFDPTGKDGVIRGRLLQKAGRVLKLGGILIIQTAHQEGTKTYLPNRDDFVDQMTDHGFRVVVELHQIIETILKSGNRILEQKVIYYGKKVTEGYQRGRPQQ